MQSHVLTCPPTHEAHSAPETLHIRQECKAYTQTLHIPMEHTLHPFQYDLDEPLP